LSDEAREKRVAVVTGAARGIGRETALELAARGYAVVANDLHEPSETVDEIEGQGPNALALAADVSDEEAVRHMAGEVRERFGRVDVLVNNAGLMFIESAEETDLADWRRVMEVNLTGPFITSREFGRMMLERGAGSIVNVSSVAGLLGIGNRAAYNASKHGLVGLTRTLAAEWGGRGVRVNAVCPGWVKTERDAGDQAGGDYDDADIEGRNPMGRFAEPGDIARAAAFLADPSQSGFVNGHTLSVDGGWASDGSWESLRRSKQRD
jgi:NAD(P)-dependent dehydrogenase (short-subunit alcohol dehydrogenase family)